MAEATKEFEFKVRTVRWFGILSAVVILLMVSLGFWYLDKILKQSVAYQSQLNFQETLTREHPDPAIVTLGLEHDGLSMRNKRTLSALYMRAYSQFLAIIAGTVLALLGAVFVLARVDSVATEGEAGFGAAKFMLRSASPGIIVTTVGALLIGGVVVVSGEPITATDRPIFQSLAGVAPTPKADQGPGTSFDVTMKQALDQIRARTGETK